MIEKERIEAVKRSIAVSEPIVDSRAFENHKDAISPSVMVIGSPFQKSYSTFGLTPFNHWECGANPGSTRGQSDLVAGGIGLQHL